MARARGGATGAIVAAVILSIFFVFSLLAAIIFYTQYTDAQTGRVAAQEELRRVIQQDERVNPTVAEVLAEPRGRTVVGALLEEVRLLRQLASPDPQANAEAIRRVKENLDIPAGVSLIAEVQRLRAELAARQQQIGELNNTLTQARQSAEAAETERANLATEFERSINQVKSENQRLVQDLAAARAQFESMRGTLEGNITTTRSELQTTVADQRARMESLETENQDLRRRIEELLRDRRDALVDTTIRPDGRILGLLPDSNMVSINLGRQHRVIPGMTFEVFAPNDIIKPDEYEEVRGKATVEVVNVHPTNATARIVRRNRGVTVNDNDNIVNLAYDATRVVRFYTFGDFDIIEPGRATIADKRIVDGLVTRFGGRLATQLSYDVDYLVLGVEPMLPDPLPPDVIEPELIAEHIAATQKYETYQSLIATARDLRIPVLNQNRFLALVGHYER